MLSLHFGFCELNNSLDKFNTFLKCGYRENIQKDVEVNLTKLASLESVYNRSGLYIINATSGGLSYVDILSCQIFNGHTEGDGFLKKISSTHDFNDNVVTYFLWNGQLIMNNKQSYPINVNVVYIG